MLIDLRTHVLSGRAVQDLVHDALRGAGVELAEGDLDFPDPQRRLLILVDSLNELPDPADAQRFHTFFNRDAANYVLIASQVDLIRRDDLRILNLADVTPEQAAAYLDHVVGREGAYAELPAEAQALARNPQDLALLAEVAQALDPTRVPTHRAELYREMLDRDGALKDWVAAGDPRLAVVYALAFRMVMERRVLRDDQLRDWIAAEPGGGDAVADVVQAMQASRLFRPETERNVLGKQTPVIGFRHELIGKFLAARHVRRAVMQGKEKTDVDYVGLSGEELWLDILPSSSTS